jgi:hypothetical protein
MDELFMYGSEMFIKNKSFVIIEPSKFNSQYIKIELNPKYQQIQQNQQHQNKTTKMNGFYEIIYKSPSFHIDGLTFETPWMYINKPMYRVNADNEKNYIELTFKNIENDSQIQQFFHILQDLDKYLINYFTHINQQFLFGKNIRMAELPFIKLKLNIIQKYVEFNNVKFLNIRHFFDSVDISNSVAKCFIHCSGIWNYNGRFGMSWKIIAMKINKDVDSPILADSEIENASEIQIPLFEYDADSSDEAL